MLRTGIRASGSNGTQYTKPCQVHIHKNRFVGSLTTRPAPIPGGSTARQCHPSGCNTHTVGDAASVVGLTDATSPRCVLARLWISPRNSCGKLAPWSIHTSMKEPDSVNCQIRFFIGM